MPFLPGKTAGERPKVVLVVEKFFGTFTKTERTLVAEASAHIETALRNCMELESVPFASVLRGLRRLTSIGTWLKTALLTGIVAAIVAAALLVKTDFSIVADGELQPARLRDVFAVRRRYGNRSTRRARSARSLRRASGSAAPATVGPGVQAGAWRASNRPAETGFDRGRAAASPARQRRTAAELRPGNGGRRKSFGRRSAAFRRSLKSSRTNSRNARLGPRSRAKC